MNIQYDMRFCTIGHKTWTLKTTEEQGHMYVKLYGESWTLHIKIGEPYTHTLKKQIKQKKHRQQKKTKPIISLIVILQHAVWCFYYHNSTDV